MKNVTRKLLNLLKVETDPLRWTEISPYFAPSEIFSPDTYGYWHLVNKDALVKLNKLRHLYGKPLTVNSGPNLRRGVRSAKENLSIDGAATLSTHVQGLAFDISPQSLTEIPIVIDLAKQVGFGFIKEYKTWVHVDDRKKWLVG